MSFLYLLTWKKIRGALLAVFILLFIIGVFVLMNTGKHIAAMEPQVSPANGEDFGQFLVDHYELLVPFFQRNQQDLVRQGEPLLIKVMGDIILLNMVIGWVLTIGISMVFSVYYAPRQAGWVEAVIYASWRVGVDIGVFVMASFGAFGWELVGSPFPVAILLIFFVFIEIIMQSFVVANIYHTTASTSTFFCIILLMILILVGTLIFGSIVKKRLSIVLAQFVDVQSVTADLQAATTEAKRELNVVTANRDDANQKVLEAQAKVDQIDAEEEALRKDIETKKNSEVYVYGRIIRMRSKEDLATARDQVQAFLTRFPSGTLVNTAKAQLALINQGLANQEAEKAQAVTAGEQARADLLARAAKGQVTLVEMRHALLGKTPLEVQDMFGKPTMIDAGRWGYTNKMLLNPDGTGSLGLTIYFFEGAVQSVEYCYDN